MNHFTRSDLPYGLVKYHDAKAKHEVSRKEFRPPPRDFGCLALTLPGPARTVSPKKGETMHTQRLWLLSLLVTAAAAVAGCKPDYPSCETDKDCHEKEFCVDRKCQQCRDAKDCRPGQSCSAGKCEAIPGYCKS